MAKRRELVVAERAKLDGGTMDCTAREYRGEGWGRVGTEQLETGTHPMTLFGGLFALKAPDIFHWN